jgi:acyl carrier protein
MTEEIGMLASELEKVFRNVFQDDKFEIYDELTADLVEKWDSLAHINLIVEVEKAFSVKFRNAEIARLRNVGDLKQLIKKHRPDLTE